MPNYGYKCGLCDKQQDIVKPMAESQKVEPCPDCGAVMNRLWEPCSISGTRDGFGIKNSFTDPESGKEIDTWKAWEKAGYKQLKDAAPTKRRHKCAEKIKEKKDKLKGKVTI